MCYIESVFCVMSSKTVRPVDSDENVLNENLAATIHYYGQQYSGCEVRRTGRRKSGELLVIPSFSFDRRYKGDFPQTVDIGFEGRRFTGELCFRRLNGSKIPVYSFRVER